MSNYDMSAWPGRTYKYYAARTPLYEFGHGLSLTNFSLHCEEKKPLAATAAVAAAAAAAAVAIASLPFSGVSELAFTCTVTNIGEENAFLFGVIIISLPRQAPDKH